jgi:PAS domain S-box-containing protein
MSVATNREEFGELLTQSEYDVILADYSLPDFDAPRALDAAAAASVTVPFICVSGTVSEDQAVELLEHGAVDYVLKDHMGRLAFAIRRALNALAEKAARRESEARFHHLFENMPDPMVVIDGAAVLLANPAARAAFGFELDADATGVDVITMIHPDDQARALDELARLAHGERIGASEYRLRRVDGSDWFGELTSSFLHFDGKPVAEVTIHDLTQRKRQEGEIKSSHEQLERLLAERGERLKFARSALVAVTAVISRTVEIRDPYTAGHQRRVAELATAIALAIGLPDDDVEEIAIAAAIHDIGKVSIPAEVLSKPAALSALEFELVKTHSQAGYDIISSADLTGAVPEIVLQHHERCDGSGYPRGLTGDQLLIGAKIIMVADVVEAMSSHRPYRSARGIQAARDEITTGAGSKYDETVVKACIDALDAGFAFEDVAAGAQPF